MRAMIALLFLAVSPLMTGCETFRSFDDPFEAAAEATENQGARTYEAVSGTFDNLQATILQLVQDPAVSQGTKEALAAASAQATPVLNELTEAYVTYLEVEAGVRAFDPEVEATYLELLDIAFLVVEDIEALIARL
jgi:uncharacterized protein YceK